MSVLNSSSELYIGNSRVKKALLNGEEVYRDYSVLFNFGSGSAGFQIYTEEIAISGITAPYPGVYQGNNFVHIPPASVNTYPFFVASISPDVVIDPNKTYGVIADRTETSSVTANLGGFGIQRTGLVFLMEFYRADFAYSSFIDIYGNAIGKNKSLTQLDFSSTVIPGVDQYRYFALYDYPGTGTNPLPSMRLYDFVEVN